MEKSAKCTECGQTYSGSDLAVMVKLCVPCMTTFLKKPAVTKDPPIKCVDCGAGFETDLFGFQVRCADCQATKVAPEAEKTHGDIIKMQADYVHQGCIYCDEPFGSILSAMASTCNACLSMKGNQNVNRND